MTCGMSLLVILGDSTYKGVPYLTSLSVHNLFTLFNLFLGGKSKFKKANTAIILVTSLLVLGSSCSSLYFSISRLALGQKRDT